MALGLAVNAAVAGDNEPAVREAVAAERSPPPPPPDFTPPSAPPTAEGMSRSPVDSYRADKPEVPRLPDASSRRQEELPGDLLILDRLLQMSNDQLLRVRNVLERLEAMEPEEREEMRKRLREFHNVTPEERRRLREKWRAMTSEERREALRELRERDWDRFFDDDEKARSAPDEF